jgi:hypothetical protein
MDLEAANLANQNVRLFTRAAMIVCFVIAATILVTSLARSSNGPTEATTNVASSSQH